MVDMERLKRQAEQAVREKLVEAQSYGAYIANIVDQDNNVRSR